MVARLALRIGWSVGLVVAITCLLREAPAYELLQMQSSVGQVPRPVLMQELLWTITVGAITLWLIVLDLFLLRWLVPMPSRRCPGCNYDLASSNADRCPECGAG
jgi:hypothetical protein